MWLFWIEICCRYKIHTGFQRLNKKNLCKMTYFYTLIIFRLPAISDNLIIGYLRHSYRSSLMGELWELWDIVPCKDQCWWLKTMVMLIYTYISIWSDLSYKSSVNLLEIEKTKSQDVNTLVILQSNYLVLRSLPKSYLP